MKLALESVQRRAQKEANIHMQTMWVMKIGHNQHNWMYVIRISGWTNHGNYAVCERISKHTPLGSTCDA